MAANIRNFGLNYRSHTLYDVTFHGETIKTLVTRIPCIVDTWISDMMSLHLQRFNSLFVGLDIKWRPTNPGDPKNPPDTLQLCIGHNCLIFQLRHSFIPPSLFYFLDNARFRLVGVGISDDVQKLSYRYGLVVRNTIDLRYLAADLLGDQRMFGAGLVSLSRRVLGRNFEKPMNVTLSNWDNPVLTLDQIQYACVDAFVSFEMGRRLLW